MRTRFRTFRRLLPLLFFGWSAAVFPAEIRIVIAATADLHGACAQMERQIAPWLAGLRKAHPGSVLYLDCGDVLSGSAEAFLSRGAGPLALLNQLECAAWVPGNHDFEFGTEVLAERAQAFRGDFLCANVDAPALRRWCRNWTIVKVNGVRIGVIGLTVPRLEHSIAPPGGAVSLDELPALRRAIAELQAERADFLILLRHAGPYGGFGPLHELLQAAPGISLVIGGHTHQPDPGQRIGGAWYVQSGPHGSAPVEITVVFDSGRRKITQIFSRTVILPQEPEPEIADPRPLPIPNDRAPGQWVADAMRNATGSDLALYALSKTGAMRLANHPATFRALYDALPYYEPVLTMEVTPAEFRLLLEEYLASAKKRSLLPALAGGTFKLKRGVLTDLHLPDSKPVLQLALTGYDAAGAGGRLPRLRELFRQKSQEGKAAAFPANAPLLLEILTVSPKKTP